MGNKATTIDEQINLLKSRGMTIRNSKSAEETLLDIGYYRLGFYWYHFEKYKSESGERTHEFLQGTDFDDVLHLYSFDFELRTLLMPYINRVEINFRTYLTYYVSNKYPNSPTWFADPTIVNRKYVENFPSTVYTANFKSNDVIKRHHKKHINDIYAPAWKTIEFMPLGAVILLWENLKDEETKSEIGLHYGIRNVRIFDNYINLIRKLRNICAHGKILYDWNTEFAVRKTPFVDVSNEEAHKTFGVVKILLYFLGLISEKESSKLMTGIRDLLTDYMNNEIVYNIILNTSRLSLENCR